MVDPYADDVEEVWGLMDKTDILHSVPRQEVTMLHRRELVEQVLGRCIFLEHGELMVLRVVRLYIVSLSIATSLCRYR
jgi:hypothetical protein